MQHAEQSVKKFSWKKLFTRRKGKGASKSANLEEMACGSVIQQNVDFLKRGVESKPDSPIAFDKSETQNYRTRQDSVTVVLSAIPSDLKTQTRTPDNCPQNDSGPSAQSSTNEDFMAEEVDSHNLSDNQTDENLIDLLEEQITDSSRRSSQLEGSVSPDDVNDEKITSGGLPLESNSLHLGRSELDDTKMENVETNNVVASHDKSASSENHVEPTKSRHDQLGCGSNQTLRDLASKAQESASSEIKSHERQAACWPLPDKSEERAVVSCLLEGKRYPLKEPEEYSVGLLENEYDSDLHNIEDLGEKNQVPSEWSTSANVVQLDASESKNEGKAQFLLFGVNISGGQLRANDDLLDVLGSTGGEQEQKDLHQNLINDNELSPCNNEKERENQRIGK